MFHCLDFCRRFAHLLAKKDVCSPEVKKELLKKVKSAISATAERFSGYMQNVSIMLSGNSNVQFVQCWDCVERLSSFNCVWQWLLIEWQWLLEQGCLSITACNELNIISPGCVCLKNTEWSCIKPLCCIYPVSRMHMSSWASVWISWRKTWKS